MKRGFTLIEVMIGIALMLVIFIGVYGLINLSFKMVAQSKARITASSLANEKMEIIRNLSYDQVGTVGGIPAGTIQPAETQTRNSIVYIINTTIIYIDDPFDNLAPADPTPTDYKRVKVKISWAGFLGGEIFFETDVSPKGIESNAGGGLLSILVFDASGQPVPQADIHIQNSSVSPPIDQFYQSDNNGRLFLPGAPACGNCYKITVTKSGFSTDRTYGVDEQVRSVALASPIRPTVSVLLGQTSEVSFSIDRLVTMTVQTIRYSDEKTWTDSFVDESKISEKNQIVSSSTLEALTLEEQNPGQYYNSGYAISIPITPSLLVEWGRLNWTDETPFSADIKYQILYSITTGWELIPDQDLTVGGIKNSEGFSDGPVDLSGLNVVKYKSIKIKANFSSIDPGQTPILDDWEITWFSSDTNIPVQNVPFSMQGAKTLGTDASGQPVYKYTEDSSTDATGQIIISGLEWDSYKISVSGATGYDVANSNPAQPVIVNPGVSQTTVLKLASHAPNTFLITIKNSAGQALNGAEVRLFKSGYDKTELTSDSGQAFFSPLASPTYNVQIIMSGYQEYDGTFNISGQSEETVVLTPP